MQNNTINIPGYSSQVEYFPEPFNSQFLTQSIYDYSWGKEIVMHSWCELFTNEGTVAIYVLWIPVWSFKKLVSSHI